MFEDIYNKHPNTLSICNVLKEGKNGLYLIKGLSGSSRALLFRSCFLNIRGRHLIILPDKETAAYFFTDLCNAGLENIVYFFPSSYKRSIQYGQTDEANIIMRTKVLEHLSRSTEETAIITYPEALLEKVISSEILQDQSYVLNKGERLNTAFLEELLETYNFSRTDFVSRPGQFAIRGSIMDVFSYSSSKPFRIDFFGDEVETLRTFDVDTQLSLTLLEKIQIVPNIQWEHGFRENRVAFPEYFSGSVIWVEDMELILQYNNEVYDKTEIEDKNLPQKENFLLSGDELNSAISNRLILHFGNTFKNPVNIFSFNTTPQLPIQKNFNFFAGILKKNSSNNFRNIILSGNEKQMDRIREIFSETDPNVHFEPVLKILHEGFTDQDLKIAIFTDHQIFDRYYKFRLKDQFIRRESLSLKELTGLNPGDYVVHSDHGIGIFGGLETIDINGKKQEVIRLVYKDNDILLVNIHSLHRISKFKAGDAAPPRIYKLGSGTWSRLKQNTKQKVKDIAQGLIKLYALRTRQRGFSFTPDSYLQKELEASFIYEDTPDQLKATIDVKYSMEAEYPMDRLVCGDVGFGKTEIAIRAAFKAAADSKQTVVLVPTTLLAFQHYNTFSDRLKNFPCNVDYLTRFRKPADQKRILKELAGGQIDIIIGTHKLLGKEVKFKDIGLLIIDEEQKFGVAMKEKLRQLRLNVDTLTLTATPIPRTLQFSLMGARDLSVINTPPPNRHPIITELHVFNEEIIKEGIEYELSRGGQVFFIHNRVQNIYEVEALVKKIVKNARTVVAHGQMEGRQLEDSMMAFIKGDFDILIATTIIESGLDISNANTIFVNNAQHFGLSDLHQLRGRVGRSNKKAFCYLLSPPVHLLVHEARRRLKAIEENSELGSGFSIAMQDMDIRGAGNLLGAEQSGFIAEIGLETYQRILNEAILELKENEFKDLFRHQPGKMGDSKNLSSDCQIDTDLQMLLPESYVSNISERMRLYKELDNIKDEEELKVFAGMLRDRFGPVPKETKELMNVISLRLLAMRLGFEKIIIRNNFMTIYFVQNPQSEYFNSSIFHGILTWIQKQPFAVQMREHGDKLTMKIPKIFCIDDALIILKDIIE